MIGSNCWFYCIYSSIYYFLTLPNSVLLFCGSSISFLLSLLWSSFLILEREGSLNFFFFSIDFSYSFFGYEVRSSCSSSPTRAFLSSLAAPSEAKPYFLPPNNGLNIMGFFIASFTSEPSFYFLKLISGRPSF